jgi:large subunit ribosomal protein L21
MFVDLVRQWCRLVFWWLPDDQAKQQDMPHGTSENRHEPAATQSTPAPASKSSRESSGEASSPEEDLTAIKGIGPTMDKRLRAMGIRTFTDLAAADA